jgi:ribosomal protein S18 acetylase RimI-like enzyme
MEHISIVDYKPEHQPLFEKLNRAWIEKYFYMEEGDVFTLTNPQEAILNSGGAILMALYDGVVAGTVALIRTDYKTVKLAKMTVDENCRRKGIAEALGHASIERAAQLGAQRVILFSHSSLEPAITLYLKLGFRHMLPEKTEFRRANVKMEKWLVEPQSTNNTIRIIEAEPEHAPAIAAIGRQSFTDTFGPLFGPLFVNKNELKEYLDYTYAISKIESSISKSTNAVYLAVAGEMPVGFVKLKKNSLHPQISSLSQLELQKIYVLKEFHGSGAGAGLMQAALELANEEEVEHLWLDTHIDNVRGIRFYEKHGFKIYGRHYFTIGTQLFEYHLMDLELQARPLANIKKPKTSLSNQ